MTVFDKFENKNITRVQNGYAEDIPSFFNDIIKFQFKNKEEIKKIHLSLLEYVNSKSPVFFLRLYGSYSKTKYHLQRRGFISKYKDNRKLSYCDNTFTLLFAGMKLAGIPYSCKDLEQLFNQNKLIVGFGQVSEEKELSFYTPKGAKRTNINAKGWYQAHIKPTGYGYNELNLMKLFPNPDRELFQTPNKIRQVNDVLTNEQVEILRAHFLRLIHPFNSFLVPKRNHIEYNGNNIGEENELINYVRNFLEKSYPQEYKEFDLQSIKYNIPKSPTLIKNIEWFENPKNKKNLKKFSHKNEKTETMVHKTTEKLKVGKLVKSKMEELIEKDLLSEEEINKLQRVDYSRQTLHIQYPLLRKARTSDSNKIPRYWAGTKTIRGNEYFICSEWYEQPSNNDRPHFLNWYRKLLK